ncbi:MAG: hypothetical protein NC093_10915 [Alistipes sp.]|nr:hypothetical protein [Alistipes sp.]
MPQEEKKERTYKIYIQATKEFAEVSEEVFREFYRHCKRERDALRKAGYCFCPRSAVYYCNCDCTQCHYYAYSTVHSTGNRDYEESVIPETADPLDIEIEMDVHLLEELIDRLAEIYPDAKTIIKLRYEGYSDSEISRITGIPRRTLDYKLKAALKKLGVSFEDFL